MGSYRDCTGGSCRDRENTGDKESSQVSTVKDPDRGARGLRNGSKSKDTNDGADSKNHLSWASVMWVARRRKEPMTQFILEGSYHLYPVLYWAGGIYKDKQGCPSRAGWMGLSSAHHL